jgi:signal transduction histidine kinase
MVAPLHLMAQLPEAPLLQVVSQYFANVAVALFGAIALIKYSPEPRRFDRMRTMIVFIVLAGFMAPFVTSVLLATVFVVGGLTNNFWLTVIVRTITNAFAILTLVPLIVESPALLQHRWQVPARRFWEACALALALVALATVIFVVASPAWRHSPVLLYTQVPLLLWAAIRFGVKGACLTLLALGAAATWGVSHGTGPFVTSSPVESALSVVFFLNVITVSLLLLAAVLTEHHRATGALAASNRNFRTMLTAASRAEAARREFETLHEAVLASLQEQIAVVNRNGVITEVNDSWRRFAQHSAVRALERVLDGSNYIDVCAHAAEHGDGFAAEMQTSLRAVIEQSEVRRQLEYSAPSAAGTCWFEISIERLRRPEGGAVISRTDVTQRKQTEREVLEKRRQVSHLGRAAVLGELSGAFAHELNQPLTSILGNAEAGLQLLTRRPADLGEIGAILRDIVDENVRASEVLQRLRALLVRGETQKQPVDLNAVIEEVLSIARGDLIARSISTCMELDRSLPRIIADRVEMQQVVLNLTLNGCEAMMHLPPQERKLIYSTRHLVGEGQVELSVRDHGIGITMDNSERVFQPFVTSKKHGMGLGLAICRSIIEAHNGRIWAEAAPGGGAVFRFNVPVGGEVA